MAGSSEIGRLLREAYGPLVTEPLPDALVELLQRLEAANDKQEKQ